MTEHQDGTVTRRNGRALLRFERTLRHPPERVWTALTDPAEVSAWLARAELDPRPGGAFRLHWLNTDDNGDSAVASGTVTVFDPPRVLELDSDIHGRMRWELTPRPPGTLLVFTSDLEMPQEYTARTMAGWHVHLDYLEEALEGARVDWDNWSTARWQAHHDRYARLHAAAERVPPEYGRNGPRA
jgi:uncharacterized protein YndB with AHSA1/START domain